MSEAINFILESCKEAKGSEVFVPKLRAYTILDIKEALADLLNDTGDEIIGIREGEKMHETLINHDEMRYAWEFNEKYVIFNESKDINHIKNAYENIKKMESAPEYTSDLAEKIPKEELKNIIVKAGLLENQNF